MAGSDKIDAFCQSHRAQLLVLFGSEAVGKSRAGSDVDLAIKVLGYEAEPEVFANEKLRAWKIYLDTEPIRRMQAEYLRKLKEKSEDVA